MKRKQSLLIALAVLITVSITTTLTMAQGPVGAGPALAPLANAGTAFTYQGQLKSGGVAVNGACDFQFGLWDALPGGNLVGGVQTLLNVTVTNGLFTAQPDFGPNAINGEARWLEMTVRCPAGSGTYTPLRPIQPMTPAPLALALPGLYTQQNATSPNVIGGYSGNVISASVVGGVIGGGGLSVSGGPNRVWASYATVGGGGGNTANGSYATVSGGQWNTAADHATVGGGGSNEASVWRATVGGGGLNAASAYYATVGGGERNTASGYAATVPGGASNSATISYTLAAGRRAKANHQGAFVWADSTDADFASTAANQFLIRAEGGVGVNTSSTTANSLTVNGKIIAGGTGVPVGSDEPFVARGGSSGISMDDRSNAAQRWVIYPTGGSLRFFNGGDRMSVNNAGILRLYGLSSGAGTTLCRNSSNEIGDCIPSSLRYKSSVANLNLGLAAVAQLRPVTFDWKETGEPDLGFVAEEVDQVTPLLTTRNAAGQIEGVKYDRISALLVKAVQEQQQEIAELKTLNAAQQLEIAQLKEARSDTNARLTALEQRAQARNAGIPADSTPIPAVLAIGALLGIVVVRRPWPWKGGVR